MLSGSIQFSIPFQFNTNNAFIKIMPLYNVYCNVKDTYTNTLFNIIFRFSVCDFTYDYRVNIHDRFSW